MRFLRRRDDGGGRALVPLIEESGAEERPDLEYGNAQAQAQTINVSSSANAPEEDSDKDVALPAWLRNLLDALARALVGVGILGIIALVAAIGFYFGGQAKEKILLEEAAEYPIGEPIPIAPPAAEGGPCTGFDDGQCLEGRRTQSFIDRSRYYLRRGDAEVAIDEREKARVFFDWAVSLGKPVGAQSARDAAKRLQYLNLTCDYDPESLARIGRDKEFNPLGGQVSTLQRQRALKALSHYTGKLSGRFNPETREAVDRFQGELWFDRTGVLTSEQTVLLVCGAAEIGQDRASQNLLGTMYAAGLGVRQNTDKALQWFNEAARQGSADAAWNLALLFGTRTTESSTLVCDADLSPERADSYLKEAFDAGHPGAIRAVERYGEETPETRWRKLAGDLSKPEALNRVGKGCNPNG